MSLKAYYQLAKPGIIYGNLISATAGYLLASQLDIRWPSLVGMEIGFGLVIGSACVFNNLYDRDIDRLMKRTRKRPSVTGEVGVRAAKIYGILLAVIGFGVLLISTNLLSFYAAAAGFIVYVTAYTLAKRKTHYSTLIGSLSGATPIVGGYLAYSDRFTSAALIIGLMMLIWQMPHFYAIAIYREKDYRQAGVPVLSVVRGKRAALYWMAVFSLAFVGVSMSLYWYAPLSLVYLIVIGLTSIGWLALNCAGLFTKQIDDWARKSFLVSLGMMLIMSVMISFA